jgi:DNA-directed RNA polymerase subunit RPC12/RpoP
MTKRRKAVSCDDAEDGYDWLCWYCGHEFEDVDEQEIIDGETACHTCAENFIGPREATFT